MSSVLPSLKARIEWRFDYVLNDKSNTKGLFLAATLMDFRFKKFDFIKDEAKRKQLIKK